MPTAAVIVIGEEILSGKFADENGPWLIARLRALGCDLRRLVVVGDEPDAIADEVRRCAATHDHVLTTGGVGPTHDDRTFEGIGLGLGAPLAEHPELLVLLDAYGLPRTETNLRMVRVPVGAVLERGGGGFPTVRVGNVWVFPGVPVLMRARFESLAPAFAGEPVRTERVEVERREVEVAAAIEDVARAFPSVGIGSYPRYDDGGRERRVVITLEARDPDALAAALERLASDLGVSASRLSKEGSDR
ncbi:MAG: competence/damage-inducible protein A [Alphaproteobacteria bacterium]|nr:competence/damage-inducible protein A [Alphaproteobacteria bacterium]MCB9698944.1 competence/damage-inducible protein A [Alphaproteobacteria bacterium]